MGSPDIVVSLRVSCAEALPPREVVGGVDDPVAVVVAEEGCWWHGERMAGVVGHGDEQTLIGEGRKVAHGASHRDLAHLAGQTCRVEIAARVKR